jgi:hypothetical protein
MAIGVYPGSFNPPTVAHLAIARAALEQCGLERVDLVLSHDALGKHPVDLVSVADRSTVLAEVAAPLDWLGHHVTTQRLIVDIAQDYDVVVLGADKWAQVIDPAWYGDDPVARDHAVSRLPTVAFAPRLGHDTPGADVIVLDLADHHRSVSASAVREGRLDWMLPEALDFAHATGAWTDPERYALRATGRTAT